MNRKLRLLLVDDEAEILELLTLIFRDCDSKTALSAESALEALRRNAFDVLITDIKMPGGLGFGLIDAAKQISTDLAVIVITGHYPEMPKDITEKVHRWILKPFTSQTIREAVRSATEKL